MLPCWSRSHCCSICAPRTEPSSRSGVNHVDIELQKQLQVRARPHTSRALPTPPLQLLLEAVRITCPSVIRTTRDHPDCLQVSGRCQRHRDSILPEPSTSSSRWHQPTERPEPSQPHRLTRVCALAPRLPQLFNHHAKAAQVALCRTEKPSVVCRHSSSTRSCSDGGKGSRAAAWATCSAAAAAPRLRTSPQWAGGPAIAFVLSV